MNVGVVDIGTNSMRLLITDGSNEVGRWVEVTGLGRGVDRTGVLADKAIKDTLEVFARFEALMTDHRVVRRSAIATSASRDAANRESFFDRAEGVLGVRPELISGEAKEDWLFLAPYPVARFQVRSWFQTLAAVVPSSLLITT